MPRKPQTRTEKEIRDFLTRHYRRLSNIPVKTLTQLQLRRYTVEMKALDRLAALYGFLDVILQDETRGRPADPVEGSSPEMDETVERILKFKRELGGDQNAATDSDGPNRESEVRSD